MKRDQPNSPVIQYRVTGDIANILERMGKDKRRKKKISANLAAKALLLKALDAGMRP